MFGCFFFHKWADWVFVRRIEYKLVADPKFITRQAVVQSRTCTRCNFIEFHEQDA